MPTTPYLPTAEELNAIPSAPAPPAAPPGAPSPSGAGAYLPTAEELNAIPTSAAPAGASAGPLGSALLSRQGQRCDGEQCGQAVSDALSGLGVSRTATALRDQARSDPALRVQPDAQGNYPNDTILYFRPTNGITDGAGTNQHFGVVYTGADGVQRLAESTSAGQPSGERAYRADRPVSQIAAAHGGAFAYRAPGFASQGSDSGPAQAAPGQFQGDAPVGGSGPAAPQASAPGYRPTAAELNAIPSAPPGAAPGRTLGAPPAAPQGGSPPAYAQALAGLQQTIRAYNAKLNGPGASDQDTQAVQHAINQALPVLVQTGYFAGRPDHVAWAKALPGQGGMDRVVLPAFNPNSVNPNPAGASTPAPVPGTPAAPGLVWNALNAFGLEGQEGGIHKGLDQFGANVVTNARTLGKAASHIPDALVHGAGDQLSAM